MIAQIATQLKKPLPRLQLLSQSLSLPIRWRQPLHDAFQHLLTNAVDHGLETDDERKQRGQREPGRISLIHDTRNGQLRILLSDNGKGIDIGKLRARVHDDTTPDDVLVRDLIFASGFSTKDSTSQFSGRGVGLDAVRAILAEQGLAIGIRLQPHDYYEHRKSIVFILERPGSTAGDSAA